MASSLPQIKSDLWDEERAKSAVNEAEKYLLKTSVEEFPEFDIPSRKLFGDRVEQLKVLVSLIAKKDAEECVSRLWPLTRIFLLVKARHQVSRLRSLTYKRFFVDVYRVAEKNPHLEDTWILWGGLHEMGPDYLLWPREIRPKTVEELRKMMAMAREYMYSSGYFQREASPGVCQQKPPPYAP